jgi:hypothetical protein
MNIWHIWSRSEAEEKAVTKLEGNKNTVNKYF